MGNIFTSIADNPSAIFSGITTLAVMAYLLYDMKEKQEFRKKMLKSVDAEPKA